MSESEFRIVEAVLLFLVAAGTLATAYVAGVKHPQWLRRQVSSDIIRLDLISLRVCVAEALKSCHSSESCAQSQSNCQKTHSALLSDLKECREWHVEVLWKKARAMAEQVQDSAEELIRALESRDSSDICADWPELRGSLRDIERQAIRLLSEAA